MDNLISIVMLIAGSIWIGLLLVALIGKAIVTITPMVRNRAKRPGKKAVTAISERGH